MWKTNTQFVAISAISEGTSVIQGRRAGTGPAEAGERDPRERERGRENEGEALRRERGGRIPVSGQDDGWNFQCFGFAEVDRDGLYIHVYFRCWCKTKRD